MSVNLYFGKTGGGKSYKANKIIQQYSKKIIFDPTPTKNYKGDIEVENYSTDNLIKIIKKLAGKEKFTLVFRVTETMNLYDMGEKVAFFSMQLGKCFKNIKDEFDGIAVVFDELDKYVSIKQDSQMGKLAGMGRHFNCHLHCISQVPAKMPKQIRDNAYNIYAFALSKNSYYLEKFGDKVTDSLASPEFPKYHHVHWNDEKGISIVDPNDKVVSSEQK